MDPLDDALTQLHAYGCELRNGLTNHAPMVAEALHHLGVDSAIKPWVASELSNCLLRPKHVAPVDADRWQDALGNSARFADWASLFSAEIDSVGWVTTLGAWVPRLAPGFATSAAHGVIRTGHAARALRDEETDIRKLELADALASWASDYIVLAVRESPLLNLSPSQALVHTALVSSDHHSPPGSITSALGALSADETFAEQFAALGFDDDPNELSLDMAATFARLFCQSARTPLGAIVFTHAITGVAAARNLSPYLTDAHYSTLLRHAFHTGCALHSVYSAHPYTPPVDEPMPLEAPECVYDALDHGDEHVIKLTDACVTFNEACGDAFFLNAAERCRQLLPPRQST